MIELSDEMREALASALGDRAPVVVSYVDGDGQPHISFRGTTQVYSVDQLAIWARNPDGGLPNALGTDSKIALLYRNSETRLSWQFHGRARVDEDEEVRRTVFDNSPEFERDQDPDCKGKAVIIDVDRVIQRCETIMER